MVRAPLDMSELTKLLPVDASAPRAEGAGARVGAGGWKVRRPGFADEEKRTLSIAAQTPHSAQSAQSAKRWQQCSPDALTGAKPKAWQGPEPEELSERSL